MNSKSSPLGGSVKTATHFAIPLCTRSAACSAPAPPETSDMTMISAGATGSSTTSAHPAARRTGSRTDGTATIETATSATTTRIAADTGRRELTPKSFSCATRLGPDDDRRTLLQKRCSFPPPIHWRQRVSNKLQSTSRCWKNSLPAAFRNGTAPISPSNP
jgi:hypothetical protein